MRNIFVFIVLLILFLGSYGVVLMDLPIYWSLHLLTTIWVGVILIVIGNYVKEKFFSGPARGEKQNAG